MRLWHYELIPYLPRKQLVSQWRELMAIKGLIEKKGSPKSPLVNKVLEYPLYQYKRYADLIVEELEKRGYKYSLQKYNELMNWESDKFLDRFKKGVFTILFENWHDYRYLTQCYYNLQEKYDCEMISESEWSIIDDFYKNYIEILCEEK